MLKVIDYGLSILKYLIGIFMFVIGLATMFAPITHSVSMLGLLFAYRATWVVCGVTFAASGAWLLYGKLTKNRIATGHGLMAIYLCLVFATVVNGFLTHWLLASWLGNAIFAVVVGLLYLRWKFRVAYIDSNKFATDIDGLRHDSPPSRRFHFKDRH